MKRVVILIILPLIVLLQQLSSQWTSDSSLNKQVSPFGITPLVTNDGDGGAIIFFAALGQTRAYVQRIDKNGIVKWNDGNPVSVGGYLKNQSPRAICADGFGGAYLQFIETDKTNLADTGRIFVYTNRIDSSGKLLWNGKVGINLGHELFNGSKPWRFNDYDILFYKMIPSRKNGYYYSWIDSSHAAGENNKTLKLQRIDLYGNKLFGEFGLTITKDVPYDEVRGIINDNSGGVYLATVFRIFHYDSTGQKLFPDSGVYIPRFIYSLERNITKNQFVCASMEYIDQVPANSNFYISSIDSNGIILWDKRILDSTNIYFNNHHGITISDNGEINMFWVKQFSNNDYRISLLRIKETGDFNFDLRKDVVKVSESNGIGEFQLFASDSDSVFILWSQSGIHFYCAKIELNGNSSFFAQSILNTNVSDDKLHGVSQGEKGVIAVWYELGVRDGIYAQNINSKGALGPLTSIKKNPQVNIAPNAFSFIGNYPNPFNPNTEIIFELPRKGDVTIGIYDIAGREIAKHEQYFADGGRYSFLFNASTFSSGVYLCSITYEGQRITKKMQFVK